MTALNGIIDSPYPFPGDTYMIPGISDKVDLAALASAFRRLTTASSAQLGGDCFLHAVLARDYLQLKGVGSTVVVGYAGWRTGDGDNDVIMHYPTGGHVTPISPLSQVP